MLLHEAGHTEHFAHVRPDLAFEYRHLGDNAVTEGFAFIFDHLLLNRRGWRRSCDYEDSDDYVRFAAVNDLYFMRRYAAKLAYETTLHAQTGSLDAMPAEYSRRLSSATRVKVPEENYLADVDDGFYCASYLRAWMLEGALRLMLQDNFGKAWFASRRRRGLAARPLGARASTSPPSGCCSGTGAAGSTPTRCGTCSSRCSGADRGEGRPARRARPAGTSRARAGAAARRTRRSRCPARCRAAGRPPRRAPVTLLPIRLALVCASELPSRWANGRSRGTRRSSAIARSARTEGSASSLMVTPAVV